MIYALLGFAAIALIAVATLSVYLVKSQANERRSMLDLIAAGKREVELEQNLLKASLLRDEALARAVKAEAERAKAHVQLAIAQAAANKAREEKANLAESKVLAGTAAAAVDVLNSVLGKELGQAGDASAGARPDPSDPRDALLPLTEPT